LQKQKVAIILGYFILSKNHNEPPKYPQLAKNRPPNVVTLKLLQFSTVFVDMRRSYKTSSEASSQPYVASF
jgi:hypothetical protein